MLTLSEPYHPQDQLELVLLPSCLVHAPDSFHPQLISLAKISSRSSSASTELGIVVPENPRWEWRKPGAFVWYVKCWWLTLISPYCFAKLSKSEDLGGSHVHPIAINPNVSFAFICPVSAWKAPLGRVLTNSCTYGCLRDLRHSSERVRTSKNMVAQGVHTDAILTHASLRVVIHPGGRIQDKMGVYMYTVYIYIYAIYNYIP